MWWNINAISSYKVATINFQVRNIYYIYAVRVKRLVKSNIWLWCVRVRCIVYEYMVYVFLLIPSKLVFVLELHHCGRCISVLAVFESSWPRNAISVVGKNKVFCHRMNSYASVFFPCPSCGNKLSIKLSKNRLLQPQ